MRYQYHISINNLVLEVENLVFYTSKQGESKDHFEEAGVIIIYA